MARRTCGRNGCQPKASSGSCGARHPGRSAAPHPKASMRFLTSLPPPPRLVCVARAVDLESMYAENTTWYSRLPMSDGCSSDSAKLSPGHTIPLGLRPSTYRGFSHVVSIDRATDHGSLRTTARPRAPKATTLPEYYASKTPRPKVLGEGDLCVTSRLGRASGGQSGVNPASCATTAGHHAQPRPGNGDGSRKGLRRFVTALTLIEPLYDAA